MQFHDAIDSFDCSPDKKRIGNWRDFFDYTVPAHFDRANSLARQFGAGSPQASAANGTYITQVVEQNWRQQKRPFYNCYPPIIDMSLAMNHDVMLSTLKDTHPFVVCLRIPKRSVIVRERELQNVFFMWRDFYFKNESDSHLVLSISVRYQRVDERETRSFAHIFNINQTQFQACKNHVDVCNGSEGMSELFKNAVRIVVGCCLVASDPAICQRILLQRDVDRAQFSGFEFDKAVDRAIGRGLNGWNLGKDLPSQGGSVTPHFRKGYLGWRLTGKGRSIPKLVPIKSCIVKPKDFSSMPTGYLDSQKVAR